jgi:uncharacterized protein (DUF2236 family)
MHLAVGCRMLSTALRLALLPFAGWIERKVVGLSSVGDGLDEDFSEPAGEAALLPPDSVSWQVFRNPLSILIGGMAAVALELAEPRVRSGVYEHSNFRHNPMARLRRTGRATMVTVYGARSRAEAAIARIGLLHAPVRGMTAAGQPYRAADPELLTWVHATASFGFLQARDVYVEPIADTDQDRFYGEGLASAQLYGATGVPASRAAMERLLAEKLDALQPSRLVPEFLDTMCRLPLLPRPLAPIQRLLACAAVQLLPKALRNRLGLVEGWPLPAWQLALVRQLGRRLDELPLRSGPPAQACRRLGLPDNYLSARQQPAR